MARCGGDWAILAGSACGALTASLPLLSEYQPFFAACGLDPDATFVA